MLIWLLAKSMTFPDKLMVCVCVCMFNINGLLPSNESTQEADPAAPNLILPLP